MRSDQWSWRVSISRYKRLPKKEELTRGHSKRFNFMPQGKLKCKEINYQNEKLK